MDDFPFFFEKINKPISLEQAGKLTNKAASENLWLQKKQLL